MELRLRDVVTRVGCVKLALRHVNSSGAPMNVKMVTGTRALIRPDPYSDYNVFYEVFVKRVYDPPMQLDRDSVKLVVDLGANVGFSNLFWLECFPNAEVLTYEPHPIHVALAVSNFQVNGLGARVLMRPVAAGTSDGEAFLTSEGSESTIVNRANSSSVKVPTVDFFKDLPARPIDILKMDIEGGEYQLLRDSRFSELRPKLVCMEAHPNEERRMDQNAADAFWMDYWRQHGYNASLHKGIVWASAN